MDESTAHRKRNRHFHDPGDCHESTSFCYHRRPRLTNDAWRGMLSKSIDRAKERHRQRLVAFVYMPGHLHLLVYPLADASDIDQLLWAIKRPFSFRINPILRADRSPLLDNLTIR